MSTLPFFVNRFIGSEPVDLRKDNIPDKKQEPEIKAFEAFKRGEIDEYDPRLKQSYLTNITRANPFVPKNVTNRTGNIATIVGLLSGLQNYAAGANPYNKQRTTPLQNISSGLLGVVSGTNAVLANERARRQNQLAQQQTISAINKQNLELRNNQRIEEFYNYLKNEHKNGNLTSQALNFALVNPEKAAQVIYAQSLKNSNQSQNENRDNNEIKTKDDAGIATEVDKKMLVDLFARRKIIEESEFINPEEKNMLRRAFSDEEIGLNYSKLSPEQKDFLSTSRAAVLYKDAGNLPFDLPTYQDYINNPKKARREFIDSQEDTIDNVVKPTRNQFSALVKEFPTSEAAILRNINLNRGNLTKTINLIDNHKEIFVSKNLRDTFIINSLFSTSFDTALRRLFKLSGDPRIDISAMGETLLNKFKDQVKDAKISANVRDAVNNYASLRTNLFFDYIARVRAEGGGIGQITEREMAKYEAAQLSLDIGISENEFNSQVRTLLRNIINNPRIDIDKHNNTFYYVDKKSNFKGREKLEQKYNQNIYEKGLEYLKKLETKDVIENNSENNKKVIENKPKDNTKVTNGQFITVD